MPNVNTMKDHRSLFRQLLAGMYDAVLITDPSGHLLSLNPRAKEFLQFDTEEVMDSPIGRFIPGVTPEIVQRIRTGLAQARHMMLDANCLRRDGTAFAAEVTVSLIDLMDPGDLVFTIRNTERRRRQLEVFRSKQNAFDLSQAALFACHPDGRFTLVNRAFLEMFGFADEDEALKQTFAQLLDDEPLAALFEQALAGERTALRITAENDDSASQDVEIQLGPNVQGKKTTGIVGSIIRV
ncbi:MAG: PAS domain-containing protein [Kiritimatiellia bacterium]